MAMRDTSRSDFNYMHSLTQWEWGTVPKWALLSQVITPVWSIKVKDPAGRVTEASLCAPGGN